MSEHEARVAQIEANVTAARMKLDLWARHMAARYGGPVLLVGSTLRHPAPRDCDIRIVIPDQEFAARYGMTLYQTGIDPTSPMGQRGLVSARLVRWDDEGPTQAWIDDVAKFNRTMSLRARLNMDIQVWPESHYREPWPPPLVLAEPSPSWFVHNAYFPERRADGAA